MVIVTEEKEIKLLVRVVNIFLLDTYTGKRVGNYIILKQIEYVFSRDVVFFQNEFLFIQQVPNSYENIEKIVVYGFVDDDFYIDIGVEPANTNH